VTPVAETQGPVPVPVSWRAAQRGCARLAAAQAAGRGHGQSGPRNRALGGYRPPLKAPPRGGWAGLAGLGGRHGTAWHGQGTRVARGPAATWPSTPLSIQFGSTAPCTSLFLAHTVRRRLELAAGNRATLGCDHACARPPCASHPIPSHGWWVSCASTSSPRAGLGWWKAPGSQAGRAGASSEGCAEVRVPALNEWTDALLSASAFRRVARQRTPACPSMARHRQHVASRPAPEVLTLLTDQAAPVAGRPLHSIPCVAAHRRVPCLRRQPPPLIRDADQRSERCHLLSLCDLH